MTSFLEKLDAMVEKNNSTLCIGLDTHETDAMHGVVTSTLDKVCAYKLNPAFFTSRANVTDVAYSINRLGIPLIFDAKYGDVSHTNRKYAEQVFDYHNYDAVTVNPLVGLRDLLPFFNYVEKQIFVWVHSSSNNGYFDLDIIEEFLDAKLGNMGFVVGANDFADIIISQIREADIKHPILVPGIGYQGGTFKSRDNRIIASCSRSIINRYRYSEAANGYRGVYNARSESNTRRD